MKHTEFSFEDVTPVTPDVTLKSTFVRALNLALVDADPQEASAKLLSSRNCIANFMNAHCCNVHARDRSYRDAIERSNYLLPDGIGIDLAASLSGETLTANLNGTDLLPVLLAKAARMGKSVFLFGGSPGTAVKASEALTDMIPDLCIAGTRDGYAEALNDHEVIAHINNSGADVVLVALGVPKQEIWIDRHASLLNADLVMGVGAAFDFLAGNVSRAPKLVRKMRMEWVWRLAMEPRRLASRYLLGNFSFLARASWTMVKTVDTRSLSQRALDLAIALPVLALLAPFMVMFAIAIRAESKGPVIFKQTRSGKDGKEFTMLKFRSMVLDAEEKYAALQSMSDRDGVCFKSKDDPRVTDVGRFIRRCSIDELPQLWNVIRGDMSLVGPRPALPSEVAAYPSRALKRLSVRPGITGLWQVSGRADVSFEEMVDMDLSYASNRSIAYDLILLGRTFNAVFSGRGAY